MNFTFEQKKQIDYLATTGVAGIVAYNLWKKKPGDYKQLAIATAIAALIAYIIITQITKGIYKSANKPKAVPVPSDTPSGSNTTVNQNGTINFNPQPYTDRLKNDIYSSWYVTRDSSIYHDLSNLSNAELVMVYNDWTIRYYSLNSETMVQAMKSEHYLNWGDNVLGLAETIEGRLTALGCV